MRPTHLKKSLCAEVADYIAAGGRITTATKRPEAVPYLGTDKQAVKVLACARSLAAMLRMSESTIQLRSLEPSFPQVYLHAGERKWYVREVMAWQKRNMSHV